MTSGAGFDMVAAAEWPELPADVVLLSPVQCRTLWRQFSSDSMYAVRQVSVVPMPRLFHVHMQHTPVWLACCRHEGSYTTLLTARLLWDTCSYVYNSARN